MAQQATYSVTADQSLVVATQSGDVAAFTVLVERYYASLLRSLIAQTGEPELAAELTQETFQRAFQFLDRLGSEQPFALWLYGIARNVRRAEMRRQHLRSFVSLDWLLDPEGGRVCCAPLLMLSRPDETAGVTERDLVHQVITTLNSTMREAIVLRYVWGFTSREIALLLGLTHAAAQRRIGRATVQFRQCYRALDHGSGAANQRGEKR